MNETTTTHYCNFSSFTKNYQPIHGPLSFFVCAFGSIANVLNIFILSTREMRAPTNLILTGLAVADLLVMLEYIPFIIHRYVNIKHISSWSRSWASFMIFHALFTQVFHFISCCLTVILAIWRYLAITYPTTTKFWFQIKSTFHVIVLTYILCPAICTPLFLSLYINGYNQTCDENGFIIDKEYLVNYTRPVAKVRIYNIDVREEYKLLSFWIYGVFIKLIPCILLTELSRRLIVALCETKKRRRMLLNSNKMIQMETIVEGRKVATTARRGDKEKMADRTSAMLVAVLVLFLITEFPQGILGLMSAILGMKFQEECYNALGDVMDILALTNSAINFILYCTMSRQFRTTFRDFVCRKFFKNFDVSLRHNQHNQQYNNNGGGEKTQISAI